MKNIYFSILILLILAMPVFGQKYNSNYEIYSNKILVELDIFLEEPKNTLEIDVPKDAKAIEVKNFSFDIADLDNKNRLVIKNPDKLIKIKYITGSFLEKSGGDNFFILDLEKETEIMLKLPEKAVLKYSLDSLEQSIFPKTNNVFTDGKRIIINWDKNSLNEANSILVIYNEENDTNFLFWLILILVLAGLFFIYKYKKKIFHKSEKTMTTNLFEEEKQIISILLKENNNELWQKQLELKSGISKVRLSRKLRNLEQKGLIEKIPYGNTNKIRLKK